MTSFVESKDFYFIMCNNTEGDKMNDHIEGVLFTDKISSLKKKLNAKRLQNIMEGKVFSDYRMKFINKKGR